MNKIIKDSTSLISSVLFLLIGIILFTNPNGIISFISYILGAIVVVIGIVKIVKSAKNQTDPSHDSMLTLGIICIVVGIIIMFCSSTIELVLRIFMGAWILLAGVTRLVSALNLKKITPSNTWIGLLIISILLIIIGLYVIIKSNLVFSSIGLILIIFSTISIIGYFITPKQKNENLIK
ncbi:MAG: DUF308 domain-containing protein [Clostridium sp.]|nr:DUF308 domain-containing protein [Clostridium sp.]MCM1444563.1 DUF308 domain-containing protein [Candidatus Amulumruptor caecigallinarius]